LHRLKNIHIFEPIKQTFTKNNHNMKTLHTPGDWYAKDGQIVAQDTGRTLAVVPYYFYNEDEEQTANANLMAAAPKLLEALKNLMEAEGGEAGDNPDQQQAWRVAEYAIQQATNP
jgi:hypothetical protein